MSRRLIAKICQQEGIQLTPLSRGWLFRLQKSGQTRYIFSNCLSLNSQSSAAIAADKFATFEVLRTAGVPIIEHAILYPFDNHRSFAEGCNTPEYLADFFNQHHHDIVLKPNHGLGGRGITHITSSSQFPDALALAFSGSDSASLCPFYHIRHEYRIIMLDGEPRLVYGKARGADWRFNLQHGSKVIDVDETSELYRTLTGIARRAVEAIDIRFCSVDIIELDPADPSISGLAEPQPAPTYLVIEVNSAVSTTHYLEQRPDHTALVEGIYRDAILKMFA